MLRRRSFVVFAASSTFPLLAGCSDRISDATLEPRNVVSERHDDADGWRTEFTVRFELTGLSEREGLTGVTAYLLDIEGEALHHESLGDYVWNELPDENRGTDERDVTFYEAHAQDKVSATTDAFPFWILFDIEEFRLTRAAPRTTAKGYVGREDGQPPDSEARGDDWEDVSPEDAPEVTEKDGNAG